MMRLSFFVLGSNSPVTFSVGDTWRRLQLSPVIFAQGGKRSFRLTRRVTIDKTRAEEEQDREEEGGEEGTSTYFTYFYRSSDRELRSESIEGGWKGG